MKVFNPYLLSFLHKLFRFLAFVCHYFSTWKQLLFFSPFFCFCLFFSPQNFCIAISLPNAEITSCPTSATRDVICNPPMAYAYLTHENLRTKCKHYCQLPPVTHISVQCRSDRTHKWRACLLFIEMGLQLCNLGSIKHRLHPLLDSMCTVDNEYPAIRDKLPD